MNAPDEGRVVIWQQADGFWRWRWTPTPEDEQPDDAAEEDGALVSHRAFDSLSEARESAHEAYPGSPVQEPAVAEARTRQRHHRGILTLLGVLALLVAARRRRDARSAARRANGR